MTQPWHIEARKMRDDGLSYRDIAARVGHDRTAVRRVCDPAAAAKAREYWKAYDQRKREAGGRTKAEKPAPQPAPDAKAPDDFGPVEHRVLEIAQDPRITAEQIGRQTGLMTVRVETVIAAYRRAGFPIPKRSPRQADAPMPPIRFTHRGCPGTISGHDPEAARAFIAAMGGVCHG